MSVDIVVFTLHKSASMFIHQQCSYLSELCGLPYHSPNVQNSGITARRLLTDKGLWRSHHGCFAPIRFFVDIPDLDRYRVILHLRDPRDVLVSMFYSYCYIHDGEIAGGTGYRKEVAERGIDDFVLSKASGGGATYKGDYGTGGHVEDLIGNLPARYEVYIDRLLRRSNVTFVKYEEMVTNYRCWLEKFISPFPLEGKESTIDDLVARSDTFFPKRTADSMTHIRHVAPGDHRNQLRPETIERLNEIFSNTLKALDYETSSLD